MSASILTAACVPEGIADSPEDYLARVERFAADAPFLAAVRARLRQPEPGGFFSTKAYVAALEAAFLQIAENRSAGLPDRDIEVKSPG
jgi:predicted O-linked N-acetylglucosamine transferase (SPINDLY family)